MLTESELITREQLAAYFTSRGLAMPDDSELPPPHDTRQNEPRWQIATIAPLMQRALPGGVGLAVGGLVVR
jgi:hypothetical protein